MNWLRLCDKKAGGWEVLYCAYNGLIRNFRQGMNSINVLLSRTTCNKIGKISHGIIRI